MREPTITVSKDPKHEPVHVIVESAPGAALRVERIELSKIDLQSLTTDVVSIGTAEEVAPSEKRELSPRI